MSKALLQRWKLNFDSTRYSGECTIKMYSSEVKLTRHVPKDASPSPKIYLHYDKNKPHVFQYLRRHHGRALISNIAFIDGLLFTALGELL